MPPVATQCSYWMCMHDRADVGPRCVDGFVKGELGSWRMLSIHRSVRFDADNIVSSQPALVHPRGRDPDVATFIEDRKIPPGGRPIPGCLSRKRSRHWAGIDEMQPTVRPVALERVVVANAYAAWG